MKARMREGIMLLCLAAFIGVAGCERNEPYARQGLWRPLRANDANLRAMIADPADLAQGRGTLLSSGDVAAAAVARLRADAVKPLPDSSLSSVQVSGAGAGQAAPGGAGTAAQPVSPGAAASSGDGGGT